MTASEQNKAHADRFGKGLKEAGTSFLIWVKDVVEVVSPAWRLIRQIKAHHDTPYEGSVFEWLEKADQTYRQGEYKELVEALGFDPRKINVDDFKNAWETAQIIWDDEQCQALLTRFTKDYFKAQHPLEASEFAGSAAFEVLLTIVLILVTAGAGAVAQLASKGRLVRQMNQLGERFKELAELKKTVHKHTPKKPVRSRSSGNMVEDLPADDRPVLKASPPPKGEHKNPPPKTKEKKKRPPPQTLGEVSERLAEAREKIKRDGYSPKYNDGQLTQMAKSGEIANERFHVRFMESRYLQDRTTPDQPLSGKLGMMMEGETGRGEKYWSTTFDQLEDADTDPQLISEKLGLPYDLEAKKNTRYWSLIRKKQPL